MKLIGDMGGFPQSGAPIIVRLTRAAQPYRRVSYLTTTTAGDTKIILGAVPEVTANGVSLLIYVSTSTAPLQYGVDYLLAANVVTLATGLANATKVVVDLSSSDPIAFDAYLLETISSYIDDYVATVLVAYALKKVIRTYAGSAIRVERSSDNAQQDIGFLPNGSLDTPALATFGAATNCNIVKQYDQTGGGNYIGNGASSAPLIVSSGTVISSPQFNGSTTRVASVNPVNYSNPKVTVFSKLSVDITGGDPTLNVILDLNNAIAENPNFLYDKRALTGSPGFQAYYYNGSTYNSRSFGALTGISSPSTLTWLVDNTAASSALQFFMWLNGVSQASGASVYTLTPSGGNLSNSPLYVGSYVGSSSFPTKMTMQTLIVCAGDQTAQRILVEALL